MLCICLIDLKNYILKKIKKYYHGEESKSLLES